MVHRKIYYTVACSILFFLISSCKKRLYEDPTTVTIKVQNPITGEGYKNVSFQVKEFEDKNSGIHVLGSNTEETEDSPVYSGSTDGNGYATFEFYKKKHSDFAYDLILDFSEMEVPGGDYEIVSGGSGYVLYQDLFEHSIDIDIVPYADFYIHRKNINCQEPDDKMRFRTKWLYTGTGNWTNWGEDDYFEGCVDDFSGPHHRPSDYRVTEMEIIKNGQTTYKIDTFYIDPNQVDTLKMYY